MASASEGTRILGVLRFIGLGINQYQWGLSRRRLIYEYLAAKPKHPQIWGEAHTTVYIRKGAYYVNLLPDDQRQLEFPVDDN